MINIYAIVRKEKTQRKKVTFCPKGKTFNRISFVDARSYRALFGMAISRERKKTRRHKMPQLPIAPHAQTPGLVRVQQGVPKRKGRLRGADVEATLLASWECQCP